MKRSKRKYRRNYNMLAKKYAEGGQITGSLDQFARADKNVDTFQEKLLDIQKAMLGQETDTQFGANLASAVDAGRAVGNTFMNVSTLGLINPEEMGSSILGNFQMAQMGGPINKYVDGDYVTSDILDQVVGPPTEDQWYMDNPQEGDMDMRKVLLQIGGATNPMLGAALPQEKQPFDWKGMLSQLSQSGVLDNLGQQSPMADMMGTLGQGVNKFKQAMDSGNTDRNIEAMAQKRDRVDDLKRMYGDKYNRETSRGADPRMQSYIQDLEGATTGDVFQKSPFQKMMELTQGAAETGNQVFNQASDGIGNAIGGILGGIFGAENGGMVPGYKDGGTVADYRNEDKLAEMQMAMSEPTPNAPTSGMQIDPMTGGIMIPEDFEGTVKLNKGNLHSQIDPNTGQGGIPVFTPAEGQGVVETEMERDEVLDVQDGETFVYPRGKHAKQKEKREAEAMRLKEMLNDPKVQKDMFKVATIERRLQTLETEEKAHREQIIQEKRAKEQAEIQEKAEMDQMLAEGKYISKNGTYRQGGKVRSLTEAQKARLSEVYADVPDSYQDGSEVENKELTNLVFSDQLRAIYDEAWSKIDNQLGYSKQEVESGEAAMEFANELNKIFKRDKITGVALRDQNDPTRIEIRDPSGIVVPAGGKDLKNESL